MVCPLAATSVCRLSAEQLFFVQGLGLTIGGEHRDAGGHVALLEEAYRRAKNEVSFFGGISGL